MSNLVSILIETKEQGSVNGIGRIDAAMQGLAATGGRLSAALAGVAGPIGLIAAVATAGTVAVFNLGRSFADHVEQLDNLSRQSGVAINDLRTFQQVAKNAGTGADTLTDSLYFLNRQIGQNNPLLTRLGIQSRNAGAAILELADIFDRSTDSAAKNEIAGQLLGRSGREVLKVMSGLRQVYAETNSELDKSGGLFRQSDIDAARKLDSEIDRFTTRFEGFMTRVKAASAGAANALIDHGKRVLDFYSGKINIQDVFPMGGGGPEFMSAHGAQSRKPGSDPRLAGVLKDLQEATKKAKELDSLLAGFSSEGMGMSQARLFPARLYTPNVGVPRSLAEQRQMWAEQIERMRAFSESWAAMHQTIVSISQAAASSIQNSFGTVLAGLLDRTQTWASAMKTIFVGLAQSILMTIGSILGKIAITSIGQAIFPGLDLGGAGIIPTRAAPARTIVNNYVQTLGVRDVIRQMTDPAGSMAMAARRRAASPV